MGPSSHMVAFLFILWLRSVRGRHLCSSREDFGNRLVNTQNPPSAVPEAFFRQVGSVIFCMAISFLCTQERSKSINSSFRNPEPEKYFLRKYCDWKDFLRILQLLLYLNLKQTNKKKSRRFFFCLSADMKMNEMIQYSANLESPLRNHWDSILSLGSS